MKKGKYCFRLYTKNEGWPRNKLIGFMGPQLPENAETVPLELELFEESDSMKAIMTAPNGKQKIGDVVCSDYSAAWEAFSGEHGDQMFQFLMAASDSSDAVWGFAAGKDDYHGFIGFEGEFIG